MVVKFLIVAIAAVIAAMVVVEFATHEQVSWHRTQPANGPAITQGDVTKALRR